MFRVGQLSLRATSQLRHYPRAVAVNQYFHSSSKKKEAEKDVDTKEPPKKILLTPGFIIDKLGLDDWRRSLPIGLFFAIPAFQQQILMFDVETHLLGCFMLFVGTVYHKFGDMIGAAFDARGDAILEAKNKEEDAAIENIKITIEKCKQRMDIVEITRDMVDLQRETMDKKAQVHNLMMPHFYKDITVSLLDMEVARQANEWHVEEARLIDSALETVTQQILTDKKLKKTALDEALVALADPQSASKKDAISSLFTDYFKKVAADAKKDMAVEKETTEEERNAIIERIDAKAMKLAHVEGIEEQAENAKRLIPTRYVGSLTKAFLEAQQKARGYA